MNEDLRHWLVHLFSSRSLANARPTNFVGYIVSHGKRLI
jgi:hypothetical protein